MPMLQILLCRKFFQVLAGPLEVRYALEGSLGRVVRFAVRLVSEIDVQERLVGRKCP